ncbi:MAG TPA: beta-ketoacyl synthase N-terminal-like domain-containing protein [Candidatus Binatia bacterium]|nr:beta-ketoacyl synthase N-terminal-like domain-containing protein [Candidatus Binatia bacterium]
MTGVVVTGLGVVSPGGGDPAALAARLDAGTPAFAADAAGRPAGRVDADALPLDRYLPRKQRKLVSRVATFGIVAAGRAIETAGLRAAGLAPRDVGIFGAAGIRPGSDRLVARLRRAARVAADGPTAGRAWDVYTAVVDPMDLLVSMASSPADHTAVTNALRGATCTYIGRGSAALVALREAARRIARGEQRAMVVLASDSLLDAWWRRLAGATDGGLADAGRAGCVPAEGAAAVVLEAEPAARARGAAIHARLAGGATRLAPDGDVAEALGRAMRAARGAAAGAPLVLGCSNGAPARDRAERRAVDALFGAGTPIHATRRVVGELGAAGALLDVAVGAAALGAGRWPGGASLARGVLVNALGDEGFAAAVRLEAA